ncbi:MAG TPA: hypothetical protein VF737_16285 [Gemmatimonadaceae bacterium]
MVRALLTATVAAALFMPAAAAAQASAPHGAPRPVHGSWQRFWAGFATSILAHEGGHIAAALIQGARPTFGFNRGRPTVYSGIDPDLHPHQQFVFSSAGLDVQALVDEAILDDPGHGGGPFQRGVLTGGIATTAFYLTLGRTGSVSDVAFMRRTSGLTSTQIALIYGGVALMHVIRIERDGRFADFFVRPDARAGLRVGVNLR